MSQLTEQINIDLEQVKNEWIQSHHLQENQLFVLGCSTSEVAGSSIGTAGSMDVAAHIYETMIQLKQEMGIDLAFQCCEHLNRAIVTERETLNKYGLTEVTVIPQVHAGGSMATFAYQHLKDPVVVESLTAHAGMDIGETMIGMHIKEVAVPLKFNQRQIGHARVRCCYTRPKLIGGERARYRFE